ncbi:glycosyltransferase [Microbacterium sp.]|uniref:glycosyltransferase n=1 Tax=Microbacterium sp. TaxID=51671 RepID=UPI003241CAEB
MPSVWCVVAVFNPGDDAVRVVEAACSQCDEVVIVDDGSDNIDVHILRLFEAAGASVMHHDSNRGIAAALNTGVRAAMGAGADAILFLDQDSSPGTGFVEKLLEASDRATQRGRRVGSVVPERFAGLSQASTQVDGVLEARRGIQSGMLAWVAALDDVGVLREDFFIDLVDVEFELRLRARGWSAIAAPGLTLPHKLGADYVRTSWHPMMRYVGLTPVVTLSRPFRYYYRSRNRVILNGIHGWRNPLSAAKETLADVIHFVDVVMLSTDRAAMRKVICRGVSDGLRKRTGRIPASTEAIAANIGWRAVPRD